MSRENFIAEVVDVNDPEQAGRLKIRIHGIHDDKGRVPDDSLPWARCIYSVTHAVRDGVSGPTTGAVVGTKVTGYFVDDHQQLPVIIGTLGRASETTYDFPKANRGEDFNEVLNNNIFHIGSSEVKFALNKSIGTIDYSGESITNLLEDLGEGDIYGALGELYDIRSQIGVLKNQILGAPGQLASIIAGFQSDLEYIIEDEVAEVIGNDSGVVFDIVGTGLPSIAGTVNGTNLLDQVISATGVQFGSANHLIGSLGDRLSKRAINTPEDAINRIGGSRFIMNNQMKSIEKTLNTIKTIRNNGR